LEELEEEELLKVLVIDFYFEEHFGIEEIPEGDDVGA
jgi:hypothetical protein